MEHRYASSLFYETYQFLKGLDNFNFIFSFSDMVEALISKVKAGNMPKWITVIPLLHLLKGTSKPFEQVITKVNSTYEQSWAGLQGLRSANVLSLGSQDRRYHIFVVSDFLTHLNLFLFCWKIHPC